MLPVLGTNSSSVHPLRPRNLDTKLTLVLVLSWNWESFKNTIFHSYCKFNIKIMETLAPTQKKAGIRQLGKSNYLNFEKIR